MVQASKLLKSLTGTIPVCMVINKVNPIWNNLSFKQGLELDSLLRTQFTERIECYSRHFLSVKSKDYAETETYDVTLGGLHRR